MHYQFLDFIDKYRNELRTVGFQFYIYDFSIYMLHRDFLVDLNIKPTKVTITDPNDVNNLYSRVLGNGENEIKFRIFSHFTVNERVAINGYNSLCKQAIEYIKSNHSSGRYADKMIERIEKEMLV